MHIQSRVRKDRAEFASRVFGNLEEEVACEFWTAEDWKKKFQKEFTVAKFMNLKVAKLPKICGKTFTHIANTYFGFDFDNIHSRRDLGRFAQVLFQGKRKGIGLIECEFWDVDRWTQEIKRKYPSAENFMAIRGEKLKEKIAGKTLYELANDVYSVESELYLPYGGRGYDPSNSRKHLALLAKEIYRDVDNNIIESELWTKDQWVSRFKERWPSFNSFILSQLADQQNFVRFTTKSFRYIASEVFDITVKGLSDDSVLNRLGLELYKD